ncbi:MAG: glycoside hydrolase family 3 N-terminal domain-containing protein, partial [Microvirga sp.]
MNTANTDHLDVGRSVDERVSSLMARMTLREKCYQLTATAAWSFVTPDGGEAPHLADTLAKAPGNLGASGGSTPKELAAIIGRVQRLLVENTRLGIPALFHAESLNGFVAPGHAVFPTAIGLAATWSPDLIAEMADLIRRQMRRAGVHQALSPNMDVAFDPRWGRV